MTPLGGSEQLMCKLEKVFEVVIFLHALTLVALLDKFRKLNTSKLTSSFVISLRAQLNSAEVTERFFIVIK